MRKITGFSGTGARYFVTREGDAPAGAHVAASQSGDNPRQSPAPEPDREAAAKAAHAARYPEQRTPEARFDALTEIQQREVRAIMLDDDCTLAAALQVRWRRYHGRR